MSGITGFHEPPNPWGRISEIAAKLGVKPYTGGMATITAVGTDGNSYDVWEVASKALDRLAARVTTPEQELQEACGVILTMLQYAPSGEGAWSPTPFYIACDRAKVLLDRVGKQHGWNMLASQEPKSN
jgi:hypothetical protein